MQAYKHMTLGGALAFARFAAAPVIVAATLYLSGLIATVRFDGGYVVLAVLAAVLSLLVLKPTFEEVHLEGNRTRKVGLLLAGWATILGVLLLLGYATKMSSHFSRLALFLWALLGGAGLIAGYYWLQRITRQLMTRAGMARQAAIVGVNELSLKLASKLHEHPELGLKVHGFFEDRGLERIGNTFNGSLLGRLSDLPAYVRENGIDVVFIALPIRHVKRVLDLLDELHDTTVSIYFLPDVFVFDLIQSSVHTICGLPAIALCETPFHGYQGLLKRLLDVVVASVALVILLPVMLLIAIAIKLTSRGSVVFRQRRYGLDGHEITVYKFRTMRVSENGWQVVQAERNDPRLTPIGGFLRRCSLDELPQLINVLQGRMSLVGPRPHAVAHNEEYRKLIKGYMFRHKVLPGMTGWAQVNGYRGGTERLEDMEARIKYDLDYLRNWSIAFDLKILLLTVAVVLKGEKAY